MASTDRTKRKRFTSAALEAAAKARAAKREGPDRFGVPELFIVKAGDHAFTWELRRFGGLVLQRGAKDFASQVSARVEGEAALAALCAMPDRPTFKRELRPKGTDRLAPLTSPMFDPDGASSGTPDLSARVTNRGAAVRGDP